MEAVSRGPRVDRLERPPCAWCGSRGGRPWYDIDGLGIVACDDCGLVFTSPREIEQAARERYGRREYFQTTELLHYGYDDYGAHRAVHRRVFQDALVRLERHLPERGRLLDVGCALGFLLEVASERGWQPEGMDLSPWACARARELTGLTVHQDEITSARRSAAYDAVTMFDVIEHTYDPGAALESCARLLRPGGLLYLITPNVGGIQRHLLGRHWFHFKPLEHTYYFDRRSLGRFLEAVGFEVLESRRNLRWVTTRFLCERLRYYHRGAARLAHALTGRWSWSARVQIPLLTGEIEVLARRLGG